VLKIDFVELTAAETMLQSRTGAGSRTSIDSVSTCTSLYRMPNFSWPSFRLGAKTGKLTVAADAPTPGRTILATKARH